MQDIKQFSFLILESFKANVSPNCRILVVGVNAVFRLKEKRDDEKNLINLIISFFGILPIFMDS